MSKYKYKLYDEFSEQLKFIKQGKIPLKLLVLYAIFHLI